MDREVQIISADSKEWATSPKDYLPGRLISVLGSKCSSIMQ